MRTLILFLVICLIGCSEPSNKKQEKVVRPYIEGVVESINFIPEDECHVTVIVNFADGRVQKLRVTDRSMPCFYRDKAQRIYYDDYWGTITEIELLK